MNRMNRTVTLIVVCFVLLAAACSSSDNTSSANYVPIESADSTTNTTAQASEGNTASSTTAQPAEAAAPAEIEAEPVDEIMPVVEAFDSFLALRARAITRDAELSELEAVATPAADEQVALLRDENDTRIANDSYAVRTDIAEWSNITFVEEGQVGLHFRDCTESQHTTPGGFTVVNFVTNDVTMVEVDGALKVDAIDVAQDGVASTSDEILGCVPSSFFDRATGVASSAVDEVERMVEDPRAALAGDLPSVFADDARTDLESALQSLVDSGLSRVADEAVSYRVLGMDVNRPDFTVVVSVCRTYPNGRSYIDATGAATATDLPTGSSHEEWVYVHLEAVPSGDAPDVVTEVHERGPNCERG